MIYQIKSKILLVECGLNINICQKQIHFWWTELGKSRYKRNEDSFLSAQKWLEEKSHQIIFQKDAPKAFGFLTELWNTLKNSHFEIYEIGVDATFLRQFSVKRVSSSEELGDFSLFGLGLVECGLNINICQKQIHFWWTELGKSRYKRNEDSFLSAQKWLEEKSHQIIFQKDAPKAFGFLTELWNTLKNSHFEIYEIGVDATYNTNNLKFELYVVYAEIDAQSEVDY
ncbi:hypothetical protein Glove_193g39 [Diversispora epigaea]|uniref:Uncharacterized protein n=1 Tax=Diversispora epigaea TaxID=1348612 RepID=A0A397ISN3_9GLOM|nr:hypothetical protein Glove_193g39 [Diversispora epigaea]